MGAEASEAVGAARYGRSLERRGWAQRAQAAPVDRPGWGYRASGSGAGSGLWDIEVRGLAHLPGASTTRSGGAAWTTLRSPTPTRTPRATHPQGGMRVTFPYAYLDATLSERAQRLLPAGVDGSGGSRRCHRAGGPGGAGLRHRRQRERGVLAAVPLIAAPARPQQCALVAADARSSRAALLCRERAGSGAGRNCTRNLLPAAPGTRQQTAAAAFSTVFAQPSAEAASARPRLDAPPDRHLSSRSPRRRPRLLPAAKPETAPTPAIPRPGR